MILSSVILPLIIAYLIIRFKMFLTLFGLFVIISLYIQGGIELCGFLNFLPWNLF
jgi:hypothetical protein